MVPNEASLLKYVIFHSIIRSEEHCFRLLSTNGSNLITCENFPWVDSPEADGRVENVKPFPGIVSSFGPISTSKVVQKETSPKPANHCIISETMLHNRLNYF